MSQGSLWRVGFGQFALAQALYSLHALSNWAQIRLGLGSNCELFGSTTIDYSRLGNPTETVSQSPVYRRLSIDSRGAG